LNEEPLLSIAISDALVIILRPDQQEFQGTAVAVDVARKLQVPEMRPEHPFTDQVCQVAGQILA
jgi:MinD-like ATPase involved in chromosome partitioning or flagellar assembly